MDVLFAGMRVRELQSAALWYGRLFGRAPDIVPNESEVMWRVTDGGWLYVIEDPGRAGLGLVTIAVTDLARTLAEATGRGITFEPVHAVGTAGRKATTADPDGNSLALVEVAP